MSYRRKYFQLSVLLADGRSAVWYFDLNAQADRARDLCDQHDNLVRSFTFQWTQEPPPAGDFVSDAYEFQAWLTNDN